TGIPAASKDPAGVAGGVCAMYARRLFQPVPGRDPLCRRVHECPAQGHETTPHSTGRTHVLRPTDQKVGGSSPSERAEWIRRSGGVFAPPAVVFGCVRTADVASPPRKPRMGRPAMLEPPGSPGRTKPVA